MLCNGEFKGEFQEIGLREGVAYLV